MIKKNDYELKYHFEKVTVADEDDTHRGAAIWDLCSRLQEVTPEIDEFVVIDSIRVNKKSRGVGIGSACVKEFCESYADKIIFVMSGAHVEDYETEPSRDEYNIILQQLNAFYTNIGFVNVNSVIGHYQYRETFIYKNITSEKLLLLIDKEADDNGQK